MVVALTRTVGKHYKAPCEFGWPTTTWYPLKIASCGWIMPILVEITFQQVIKHRHSTISCFFFAYFGKSRLVKYFGASEPNEREAYVTVLKAFFSKSWHPKMIQQSSNVFLFKLQSAFFPDRQQNRWIKVQSANACWNFCKVSTEGPSWVGSFLIDSWQQGTRDGGWKTPGRWSLKFSRESNPCKV